MCDVRRLSERGELPKAHSLSEGRHEPGRDPRCVYVTVWYICLCGSCFLTSVWLCFALAGASALAEGCPHEGGARDDAAVSKCQAATHKVRAQTDTCVCGLYACLLCRCVCAF
jgi:hypothetical protein